jgi:hypothetical protein
MDRKQLDHAYHRSRVDAHIGGSIAFILFMLALTFLVGDKFEPFQQDASFWEPTLLVWRADTNAWIAAYPVLDYETGEAWQRRAASYSPEDAATESAPDAPASGIVGYAMRTTGDLAAPSPDRTSNSPAEPEEPPKPDEDTPGEAEPDEAEAAAIPEAAGSGPTETTTAARSLSPVITKELYPGVYSLVVVLGSLFAAYFLYRCARRQARLMLAAYPANDPNRPYDRPWSEIRVTFWALFVVLLGVLFLFLM